MYQTTMKTTELGQTGLQLTRVGFGAWAIGGGNWEFGWGSQVAPILPAADLELTHQDIAEIEGSTR
jgi:aryl-alcohol dehydrogenase-like predicted oxidoreductase